MTNHPPDLDLTHLPELREEAVRLLWVDDCWDGPLEGIAEVRGERCLFVVADRGRIAAEDEDRSWVLYRLTSDQLAEQERWHELFVTHVGDHFDYTRRPPPEPATERDPGKFYGPYRATYVPPRLARDQAIGWVRTLNAR